MSGTAHLAPWPLKYLNDVLGGKDFLSSVSHQIDYDLQAAAPLPCP